jgi:hypothetical protein
MRDEAAGVIERGVEKGLNPPATRAPDPGAEQHISLPDLVAEFGFELLVRLGREQLPLREAALFEEAIQRGRRDGGCFLAGRQGEFAQQGRAGAMRILAFETFDEAGQLRGDSARLAPVLARLGSERLEAASAVAHRPIQQGIDGHRRALRIGDVEVAGGNLLGAPGEFAAGKTLDDQ